MWWEIGRGGAGVNMLYCVCRLGKRPEVDMRGRGEGRRRREGERERRGSRRKRLAPRKEN